MIKKKCCVNKKKYDAYIIYTSIYIKPFSTSSIGTEDIYVVKNEVSKY